MSERRHDPVFPGFKEAAARRRALADALADEARRARPLPDRGRGADGHVAVRGGPARVGRRRRPALDPRALRRRARPPARLPTATEEPMSFDPGPATTRSAARSIAIPRSGCARSSGSGGPSRSPATLDDARRDHGRGRAHGARRRRRRRDHRCRSTARGGTLDAAFTLIDTIDLLGVPVRARCVGRADGRRRRHRRGRATTGPPRPTRASGSRCPRWRSPARPRTSRRNAREHQRQVESFVDRLARGDRTAVRARRGRPRPRPLARRRRGTRLRPHRRDRATRAVRTASADRPRFGFA